MNRVIVVGFGFMGKTHVLNILNDNNLELVAIVDKDIDIINTTLNTKTGNFSTGAIPTHKIEKLKKYDSLDKCIEETKPNSVHICVHTNMHYTYAKKSLNYGLNVFIEKPFCLEISQGEELINLAKKKGAYLMVGHVVRFMPPYEKLKQWIDEKQYGKLKFLSLTRFSGVPLWGEWKEKQKSFGSTGGALFDLVIHDVDYANYIMGDKPENISSYNHPGLLSENDYINATWTYTNKDTIIKIEGGNIFHANFHFQAGFIALFEHASVQYSSSNPSKIIVSNNSETTEITIDDWDNGYKNEIKYFYECINNSKQPLKCAPESSLNAIKTCYRHININD